MKSADLHRNAAGSTSIAVRSKASTAIIRRCTAVVQGTIRYDVEINNLDEFSGLFVQLPFF